MVSQIGLLSYSVICKGAAEDIKDEGSSFWQYYYGLIFDNVQNSTYILSAIHQEQRYVEKMNKQRAAISVEKD